MERNKSCWMAAIVYVSLIYISLYFTPFISTFLIQRNELAAFIDWSYAIAGIFLLSFFYFRLKIRKAEAYGMLAVLIMLFFAAFNRLEVSTDRLHFLEHGLVYVLVYLALKFSNRGIVLIGRTMLLCSLIGLVDEGIQGLLPNRVAEWGDVWTDIYSYYLGAGVIAIASLYRRDHDRKEG